MSRVASRRAGDHVDRRRRVVVRVLRLVVNFPFAHWIEALVGVLVAPEAQIHPVVEEELLKAREVLIAGADLKRLCGSGEHDCTEPENSEDE